jgi:hypothetical protein
MNRRRSPRGQGDPRRRRLLPPSRGEGERDGGPGDGQSPRGGGGHHGRVGWRLVSARRRRRMVRSTAGGDGCGGRSGIYSHVAD